MTAHSHTSGRAWAAAWLLLAAAAAAGDDKNVSKPKQMTPEAIAALLPAEAAGLGKPAADRAAWGALAKLKGYRGAVAAGEKVLATPLEAQPDDLYLDFSKTGNRTRWQRIAGRRRGRIEALTVAECIENGGRFVAELEKTVAAICAERTWVMPAHDRSLANFKGQTVDIDLGSSHLAWEMATAAHLLGEKLSPKTRNLIRENLRRRILDPYLAMAAGTRRANWWMTTTNNWNAVCLAGVTGTALAAVGPRPQRATFVAAAMKYSKNFLRGFTPDGYCSEGLGYWSYGFGHYVLLAETLWQATGGEIDLMAGASVSAPALFPQRIEIINGVAPAFADCSVGTQAPRDVVHFISRRYGLGADPALDGRFAAPGGGLAQAMVRSFANSTARIPRGKPAAGPGARTWFDKAGVLICRPGPAATCRIGAALKGGHNAEHHNHNDVGSYVVVLGSTPVLVDPGAEVYTARTFSSKRYVSGVLNSLGHPVPRIAGQLQRSGGRARAAVLRADFSDAADTLVLDIRSAYNVPQLTKLHRTFVYSRSGAGSLTVRDEAAFSEAVAFETALITLGKWRPAGRDAIVVTDGGRSLRVTVDTGGAAYDIQAVQIKEDVRTRTLPTRIGIVLKAPAAEARVTLKITPAAK